MKPMPDRYRDDVVRDGIILHTRQTQTLVWVPAVTVVSPLFGRVNEYPYGFYNFFFFFYNIYMYTIFTGHRRRCRRGVTVTLGSKRMGLDRNGLTFGTNDARHPSEHCGKQTEPPVLRVNRAYSQYARARTGGAARASVKTRTPRRRPPDSHPPLHPPTRCTAGIALPSSATRPACYSDSHRRELVPVTLRRDSL